MPMHIVLVLVASGSVSVAVNAPTAQMDPVIIGQTHVLSGMARGYAERGVWRDGDARHSSVTSRQIAPCAQKSRFRTEFRAGHPQVERLYNLCREIGR